MCFNRRAPANMRDALYEFGKNNPARAHPPNLNTSRN
jgi:hypothetical protein